jgi:hypothetical protein
MTLPDVPSKVISPTLLLSGSEARTYAEDLAKSSMLSSFFQGSVQNVMFAMELGKVYNLEPAALLQNVHVFETVKDGKTTLKASLSANLMVYLARSAGHIVTTTANPAKSTCTIVRGDTIFAKMLRGDIDPDQLEHYSKILSTLKEMDMDPKEYAVTQAVWTMDKAQTAGLVKERGNWVKYPHAMLAARAKADCVRMACEEVLIKVADHASRISGTGPALITRDGVPIDVSWTHLADELGASINEEDGSLVQLTSGNQNRRPQHPNRAATSTDASRSAGIPPTDPSSARADIAAQAGTDPAKAGWGKTNGPTPEEAALEQVRTYVRSKPFEDVVKLLDATAANVKISTDEKEKRKGALLTAMAELLTADQLVLVYRKDVDTLESVIAFSPSAVVAEFIQEIASDETNTAEDRLRTMHRAYSAIQSAGRMDDPAAYHDLTTGAEKKGNLGSVIKTVSRPLMEQTS